ncbi:MAG: DUF460 domain-containing protein [Candidatus Syntrophoarchaeum sp.]|nr:DUF460 domain-containing protein [Candidatus Syntrophoarchaeum sp.]
MAEKLSDRLILGVDLARRSRHGRFYAVVLLNETMGTVEYFPSISKFKLIRLIKHLKPEILATDNIYEFGDDRRRSGSLVEFLRELPSNTRLIQVTGGVRQQPLTRLAKRLNLTFNRLNPVDEANACALLAREGFGDEVLFRKDKTQIKVSRARSLGKGGWSQKRYGRKVHTAVKKRAGEIRDLLEEAGLSYELRTKKGFGGYVNAVFLVDAAKDNIHIPSGRNGDVQVQVSPLARERIEFRERSRPRRVRKHIIVGVDPGTTTAVAILDLNGNLIELSSSRTRTPAEVIGLIAEIGKPLIVASDVTPAPSGVNRVKKAFNAILHEPQESLSIDTKIALARPFGYKNDHERDALAAALDAYKSRALKFEQIARKTPPGIDLDEVKAIVVRGSSIDSAISSLLADKKMSTERIEDAEKKKVDYEILELRSNLRSAYERIELFKNYLKELELKLKAKDEEIEKLRLEIDAAFSRERRVVLRERELKKKNSEIKRLKGEIWNYKEENKKLLSRIDYLKTVRKQEMRGEGIPLKVIEAFNKNSILKLKDEYGIRKGDLVLFRDASGGGEGTVRMLAEFGIRAVIYLGEMSHIAYDTFIELGIPAFKAEDLDVQVTEEVAVVDSDRFESMVEKWKELHGLMIEKKREKWFEEIVDEYRMERGKEKR